MEVKDYISRDVAIEAMYKDAEANPDHTFWTSQYEALMDIPAADVRPVVRAQIIDMRYVEEDGEWKCSRCGWQYTLCVCGKDVTSKIHFCPRCGADMRPTSMSGANGEES